jgi:hypothetical protein
MEKGKIPRRRFNRGLDGWTTLSGGCGGTAIAGHEGEA